MHRSPFTSRTIRFSCQNEPNPAHLLRSNSCSSTGSLCDACLSGSLAVEPRRFEHSFTPCMRAYASYPLRVRANQATSTIYFFIIFNTFVVFSVCDFGATRFTWYISRKHFTKNILLSISSGATRPRQPTSIFDKPIGEKQSTSVGPLMLATKLTSRIFLRVCCRSGCQIYERYRCLTALYKKACEVILYSMKVQQKPKSSQVAIHPGSRLMEAAGLWVPPGGTDREPNRASPSTDSFKEDIQVSCAFQNLARCCCAVQKLAERDVDQDLKLNESETLGVR